MSDEGIHHARIEFDLAAEMRDGTVLRADVYRPGDGDGPWPVLLVRTPYGKQSTMPSLEFTEPLAVLARGFMVVIQDCRGRGSSEGDFRPWRHEAVDGEDTVAWAAALPGSSGDVVMNGTSYFGNTQWMAASTRPAGLRAIAPMNTWSDPMDGLFRRGGAEEFGFSVSWGLLTGIETVARRHGADPAALGPAVAAIVSDMDRLAAGVYDELPAADHPALARHQVSSVGNQEVRTDPVVFDACAVVDKYDRIQVPALSIAGWFDCFSQGTLDSYVAMASRQPRSRLIVGPWTHQQHTNMQGDVNFGVAAGKALIGLQRSLIDLQLDFFKAQLAEEGEPGWAEQPPVRIFVMGINQWRSEQEWPLSRAVDTEFYLHGDGGLSMQAPLETSVSTYVYDPHAPTPTVGGALVMSQNFRSGPLDQARVESRDDVLTFTSEVLTEPVEVTGRVTATLYVETDRISTDWVVRLCDVAPNGVSYNLTDGISRTSHVPDEPTRVEVDLWSTSNVFLPGHRIRVQLTSSNFPRWDRNPNTGESADVARTLIVAHQTVHHGGPASSRVVLPVVAQAFA
jgi:uncharacterized protein